MTFNWIYYPDEFDSASLTMSGEGVEHLKAILARACNVWPDAPAEVKELHDLVIHGQLLQNYRDMPK